MKGKVVVITGATSGIGQVAAESLASMGARIVQVARDHGRGQEAIKRLRECAPDVAHSIHYADLSRLSEMKRAALAGLSHDCKCLKTSDGGEKDPFAEPLYGLTPVPRVRIPPSPPIPAIPNT
jgi:NAD(P)-dependent dehydrogenase (short-subunit alcohol dehydrogenase family)